MPKHTQPTLPAGPALVLPERVTIALAELAGAAREGLLALAVGTGIGVLGEDRDPSDGFSLLWRYPSQGLSAHLDIQATGPGGTTDKQFGIAH